MPEALKLQQGATRTLRFTLGAGINGDWTGSTLTTTLNYRLKSGSVGAEVWRREIAGGAIADGVVGEATVLASESAALNVGAYWLTLALAVPGDVEDDVWKWDEYPVVLEFAAPTSVAAAGTGIPSNAGGFTTPIKLGSVGASTSIKIGGPSISVATYALQSGDPIPIGAVDGLTAALAGKEGVGVAEGLVTAHNSAASPHVGKFEPAGAVATHLLAAPHLPAPANAATLAKITEADNLPLWDGGAWPGGGGGGGDGMPRLVQSLSLAANQIRCDAGAFGGGEITLSTSATATVYLDGATAGTLSVYLLRLTYSGLPPLISFSGGRLPLEPTYWSRSQNWDVWLESADGGVTVSVTPIPRATAPGLGVLWRGEFDAPDGTLLGDYVPEVGGALLPFAEGAFFSKVWQPDLYGGNLHAVAAGNAGAQAAAISSVDIGVQDCVIFGELPASGSANVYSAIGLRVAADGSGWVYVGRPNGDTIFLRTGASGAGVTISYIAQSGAYSGIPIPVKITASGTSVIVETPAGSISGTVTETGTIIGLGLVSVSGTTAVNTTRRVMMGRMEVWG